MARLTAFVVGVLSVCTQSASVSAAEDMRRIGPGTYRLLVADDPAIGSIPVAAFRLDRVAVTNRDFLTFVRRVPLYRRGAVPRLLADEAYLRHWASADELGAAAQPRAPVVNVSWFAAKAYCEARGARLPTEAEWELAASAGLRSADSSAEPEVRERQLAWYASPPAALPNVGSTPSNFWGVRDLHGVVWEWVYDFNSNLVAADSRDGKDTLRFCGAGAVTSEDASDYPTLLRVALRGALRGDSTMRTLGFRCARSLPTPRARRRRPS